MFLKAVLPNGEEIAFTFNPNKFGVSLEETIRQKSYTYANYQVPWSKEVVFYTAKVYQKIEVKGKEDWKFYKNVEFQPYMESMKEEDYCKLAKEVLSDIPPELHSFARQFAYEHGHSSGCSEVYSILQDICYGIKSSLEKYKG